MTKKILFLLLTSLFINRAFSQTTEETRELNCYNKWSVKFDERGAEEIGDGSYTDVIITSRSGSKAICYNGKADVIDKKLVRCYIIRADGTYEEVKRSWKNNSNLNVGIVNGISESMISVNNELVNVLWPKKIKPKKAAFMKAADPTDD